MAGPFYLRSTDGSDASDGLSWANAKATLAGAFAVMAAGETVYASQVHAETQASAMTLTSPGTAASPCRVLCVNDGAEPPTALATTATISATGNSVVAFLGFAVSDGITYSSGSTTSTGGIAFTNSSPLWWRFINGSLRIAGSNANNRMNFGASATSTDDTLVELINTTLRFANVGQGVVVRCPLRWQGGSVDSGGSIPTTLFLTPSSGNSGWADVLGVDLSALGSGKNLVDAGQGNFTAYSFTSCKLGSSVSLVTGSNAGQGGVTATLVNCDSADTNYRYHKSVYQGDITQETTIVRTGGATDGTTTVSRKMVSSANAKFFSPLESDWIYFWNETLGAVTISIPVVTDNVTLTDAEAWVEVEYLGTSGFPLGNYASDRAADILATPANQTTDGTSLWPNAPGTPIKQVLSTSVTPAEKGLIRARVMLAKASTTMYFDPKILSTSGRQYMAGESGYANEGAATTVTVGSLVPSGLTTSQPNTWISAERSTTWTPLQR